MGRETWTPERTELAKTLWQDGLSASDIAMRLGGVSRNAVIGRLHRVNASPRRQTNRIKRSGDNVRRLKTRRNRLRTVADYMEAARLGEAHHAAHAGPDLDVPEAERIPLVDLEHHHCRWPYGDSPFSFCGKIKIPGKSYCEFHVLRSLPGPPTGGALTDHIRRTGPGISAMHKANGVKDHTAILFPVDLQSFEILEKEPA